MSNSQVNKNLCLNQKVLKHDKYFLKIPIITIQCLVDVIANIDEIAAITAMKHANAQVVTASTDSVDF